jgi:hypothetical protein
MAAIFEACGDFLRALVRSVERRETSIRHVLAGTVKGASRDVLRWAFGSAVKYLIAAGLAIAAIAYLLSALHDVLAGPVGLPSYAASLLLAALGAVAALLLFRSGAARLREEPEDRGVTLKIVREERPTKGERERTRPADAPPPGWELDVEASRRSGRSRRRRR